MIGPAVVQPGRHLFGPTSLPSSYAIIVLLTHSKDDDEVDTRPRDGATNDGLMEEREYRRRRGRATKIRSVPRRLQRPQDGVDPQESRVALVHLSVRLAGADRIPGSAGYAQAEPPGI